MSVCLCVGLAEIAAVAATAARHTTSYNLKIWEQQTSLKWMLPLPPLMLLRLCVSVRSANVYDTLACSYARPTHREIHEHIKSSFILRRAFVCGNVVGRLYIYLLLAPNWSVYSTIHGNEYKTQQIAHTYTQSQPDVKITWQWHDHNFLVELGWFFISFAYSFIISFGHFQSQTRVNAMHW